MRSGASLGSARTIQVKLNGQPRELRAGSSLTDLLAFLELNRDRVAVEVNREIIRRDRWQAYDIQDGDSIEIVHFVGGGSERL